MSNEENGILTEVEIKEIASKREYTYQLAYPVEFGDEATTEVSLKRFKGKQIKTISKIKEQFDAGLKMIELSSGLSHIIVEEMDIADLTVLMEVCAVFMDASHLKKA